MAIQRMTVFFIIVCSTVVSGSQNNPTSNTKELASHRSEIKNLREELQQAQKDYNEKLAYQMQCNQKAIDSVNASISAATYAIGIFGFIVTILTVLLGLYAHHIEHTIKGYLEKSEQIERETKELDSNIKNNMKKLYNDLRTEELEWILDRLNKVPEDIINLFSRLASQDIPVKYYDKFKSAFLALEPKQSVDRAVSEPISKYSLLFYQHFPGIFLLDQELNEIGSLRGMIAGAFSHEIEDSTMSIVMACAVDGFKSHAKILKSYFIELKMWEQKVPRELYKNIYRDLEKENRFDLYFILAESDELGDIVGFYGKLLLENYKNASENTLGQNQILDKIQQPNEPSTEENEANSENKQQQA